MTDLERRALLGDKQAQEERTEKGIAIPCPFCGIEGSVLLRGKDKYNYHLCSVECVLSGVITPLEKWNTRPAPPIGRCKDCKNLDNTGKRPVCWHTNLPLKSENDFCSYYEPRHTDAT